MAIRKYGSPSRAVKIADQRHFSFQTAAYRRPKTAALLDLPARFPVANRESDPGFPFLRPANYLVTTAHNAMAVRGYEMKLESTRGPLLTFRFA